MAQLTKYIKIDNVPKVHDVLITQRALRWISQKAE